MTGRDIGEFEEILGYHLEQAFRYRSELGSLDERTLELADGARRRLLTAGQLAFRRGDTQAAINLLERARSLPSSEERAWLERAPDLGVALFQAGEFDRAESILSDAIERAQAISERHCERHAWLVRAQLRQYSSPERIDFVESLREAEASLVVLQGAGDDLALTRVWNFLWELYQCTGKGGALRDAAERGLEHARRADSRVDEAWSLLRLGYSLLDGPTPVGEGVRISEGLLHELRSDPLGEAMVIICLAPLVAMQGRFEDARALIVRSRAGMQEFGIGTPRTIVELLSGRVEMLAGDLEATEHATRTAVERSAEIADTRALVLALVDLARAICDQGDPAECLRILDESERHPAAPDWEIVVGRPAVRARALARLGRLSEAEPLAREAVGFADGTQFLGYHADALVVLAEVLHLADRPGEAVGPLEQAARHFNAKGNVVMAAKAQAFAKRLAAEREP